MEPIFNKRGKTVGWLNENVVYNRKNQYVAFIDNDAVFTYQGNYLGNLKDKFFRVFGV